MEQKYTEDDGLLYDIETDWIPAKVTGRRNYYICSRYRDFVRIVDFEKEEVSFSDMSRISKIVDMNNVLDNVETDQQVYKQFIPLLNSLLDNIAPITIPYKPTKFTAYVEYIRDKNLLGVYWFKENIDEPMMHKCKQFFKIMAGRRLSPYEELSYEQYCAEKAR